MNNHSFERVSREIKSTGLSQFAKDFSKKQLQGLLYQLTYIVCSSTHGDSREDHATNEAAFSHAIESLLTLLKTWEQSQASDGALPDLKLWLWFRYDIAPDADGPIDHNFDASSSTAARRYLEIDVAEFPSVQRISSFKIDVSCGMAPLPRTMCRLASLYPRLQELSIEYHDPAIKRQEMRKEHRFALAAGLRELFTLPRLTRLQLIRQSHWDPSNHSFECQDLEDDEHVDVLCESIRELAEAGKLVDLELKNVLISSDLFRNRRSGALGDNLMPALRRLHVEDGILAPSGKWWYTGDPDRYHRGCSPGTNYGSDGGEDSDNGSDTSNEEDNYERDVVVNGYRPDHQWRTRPDPKTFNPLIADMANALIHMPALEWACLDIGGNLEGPFAVIIQATAKGQGLLFPPDRVNDTEADKMVSRCKAWVGKSAEWEVPEKAKSLWKAWTGVEGKVDVGKWP